MKTTDNDLGKSIYSPIDEVYPYDCTFRGDLNRTMKCKPHYKLERGLWKRCWSYYSYFDMLRWLK